MDEASRNAKTTAKAEQARQRVVDKWLGIQGSQFRDPAGSSNAKTSSQAQGRVQL